jgi:hypothetical protein
MRLVSRCENCELWNSSVNFDPSICCSDHFSPKIQHKNGIVELTWLNLRLLVGHSDCYQAKRREMKEWNFDNVGCCGNCKFSNSQLTDRINSEGGKDARINNNPL